jgi:hypothetical protein
VQDISKLHASIGLADPTLGGVVSAAINEIANIPPPRSWPGDSKQRFRSLPYDLQVYIADREANRDRALRRAQNEAATTRQKLAAAQPPAKKEGSENDESSARDDAVSRKSGTTSRRSSTRVSPPSQRRARVFRKV